MQMSTQSVLAEYVAVERGILGGFMLFFFVYSYSHEAYLNYGGVHFDLFLAAVRAGAARCKLPSAIRPGLSREK
jgi:hypothetical protein